MIWGINIINLNNLGEAWTNNSLFFNQFSIFFLGNVK